MFIKSCGSLHSLGNSDTQNCQCRCHLPPCNIGRDRQYSLFGWVFFSNDSMPVVEEIESTGEREGVLGQVRWFSRIGSLRDNFFQPLTKHDKRPNLDACLAVEEFRNPGCYLSIAGC